ncbi:MAG TPA: hypothetical protein VJ508_13940 [Saprospiraceae bacterium]|nr:hypothetical protein [Saprospiraceae bacterium]
MLKLLSEGNRGFSFHEEGCKEEAGNGVVSFEEWAHWTIEISKAVVKEVPTYKWANMTCDVWKRVVLKK